MAKERRTPEDQRENEGDLLNFDLDDISSEDLEQGVSDEEIIELTDLVERGTEDEETRDMKVAGLSRDSESAEIEKRIDLSTNEIAKAVEMAPEEGVEESEEDLDVSDLSLELDLEAVEESKTEGRGEEGQITTAELEGLLKEEPPEEEALDLIEREQPQGEAKMVDEELSEADLEGLLEEVSTQEVEKGLGEEAEAESEEMPGEVKEADEIIREEAMEEVATAELESEKSVDIEAEGLIEREDLEEPSLPSEAEPDQEEVPVEAAEEEELPDIRAEPAVPESVGISEQRIEAIVTQVVQDVAERVIRETVAEVAEKVLTEAIDALKKSLESTSG